MRKYNEGYTLPFVLVVFLVTSLVAVSILTVSVHNLHGQKASVHRMEAQYAAQGEIEKVDAILHEILKQQSEHQKHFINEDFIENNIRTVVDCDVESLVEVLSGSKIEALTMTVVSEKETVRVCAVFKITGSEIEYDTAQSHYSIEKPKISYESYTISTVEPTSEESEGGA